MILRFGTPDIRAMRLERAGEGIYGDVHPWNHPSVVMRGSVEITVRTDDGRVGRRVLRANDGSHSQNSVIQVPATWRHSIVALEDDTLIWCICPECDAGTPVVDKADANLEYEWE